MSSSGLTALEGVQIAHKTQCVCVGIMSSTVNLLGKIALGALLAGVSLLISPLAAASEDEKGTPPSSTSPQAEDPRRSCPAAQQARATGESNASSPEQCDNPSFYSSWRRMTEREAASQPDWLSPLATTSGRIKDEFRYDVWRQTAPGGSVISTFGGRKGLEFIAAPQVQLLLGVPSYIDHSATLPSDGFGDLPLMVKFRITSASTSEGNYLVTVLLSATVPTASRPNGAGVAVLTPTLALGKGWGKFDVQSTFGADLPAADTQRLGRQILWNTTFQYRARWKLWPELEVNSTFFQEGKSAGETQTFLTPGLGFGRLRLFPGLRFSIAAGVQIAVSHFHTYDHRGMLSVRFSF